MALHKGSARILKVCSNIVADTTSFSFDAICDTIKSTTLANSIRSCVANLERFTEIIDFQWDETDFSCLGSSKVGTSVTLNMFTEKVSPLKTLITKKAQLSP
jgi:hypothetical protein